MPNVRVEPVRLVTTTESFFAGVFVGGLAALLFAYGLIPALIETGAKKVRKK